MAAMVRASAGTRPSRSRSGALPVAMNLDAIGTTWQSGEYTWTSKDAILYALAVGAGAQDPLSELAFTTENSHDIVQQVLPTFAVLFAPQVAGPNLGDFDIAQVLHAEQTIRLVGPLPVNGLVRLTSRVAGITDKGSGALVSLKSSIVDGHTGDLVAEADFGMFVRGAGGFGGEPGTSSPWDRPDRPADHVLLYETRSDQALLYRLTGDRNPLHSDPWLARMVGFDRPILHGLCTYGFAGRALLHALCGSDPAAFGAMSARFASPVLPGQTLAVHIWDDGDTARFVGQVAGSVVLDRGFFSRASR